MKAEKVEYKGWANCLRLANSEIEIIVTTDVGPRIISAGFIGGQNMLKNFDAQIGKTGEDRWRIYGGHRLWHAPEVATRTYEPDNNPVAHEMRGETLVLKQRLEENSRVEKQIEISLDPSNNQVRVNHVLTNRNAWAVELAPWGLTVMAQGGFAVIPQEEFRPHPDYLLPARPLVLWHFTKMNDPRWTWGEKYVILRQDPNDESKQKCGMLNKQGWAAYCLGEDVFVKRFPYDPNATYADYGCNTETYTDPDFLEVETLGPLSRVEPGESVEHEERWFFAKARVQPDEDDIDAKLLPLVEKLK